MLRRKHAFLAILVLIASAAAIEVVPWRLAVIELKLGGNLPEHTWGKVISGLGPNLWVQHSLKRLVRGEVTLAEWDTDNPCPVVWNTPVGRMRGFIEDHHILEHFLVRSWIVDPDGPKVQTGDVVLEIGAWIGAFTKHALRDGASKVIAFEPHPVNRNCFEQNFSKEIASGRVVVVKQAAWDWAGSVRMANIGPDNAYGSNKGFAVAYEGPVGVEAATIDEVVARLGLTRVDFINVDIEGGDARALRGARTTIQNFRPVIVSCLHHIPGDRKRVVDTVLEIEPRYAVERTFLQAYFRPTCAARTAP